MRALRERPRAIVFATLVVLVVLAAAAGAGALLAGVGEPATDPRVQRAERTAAARAERIGDLERRVALFRQFARERQRRLRLVERALLSLRERERQQRRLRRPPDRPRRDRRR